MTILAPVVGHHHRASEHIEAALHVEQSLQSVSYASSAPARMLSGLHATCTTCHQTRLQPARASVEISQQRISRFDRCLNTRERCPAVATATIAASASLTDAASPSSDSNLSMHPDAIKRRQDAEARYPVVRTICECCECLDQII